MNWTGPSHLPAGFNYLAKDPPKQRAHNVWGREITDREIVSRRAMQALEDNPRVKDLHIAILVREETHPITLFKRVRVFYQARWYDGTVARKLAADRRADRAYAKAHPVKHCKCCEHYGC